MLSTRPVDWYKFDDGSGIVTADSAGANPGTLVGVPPPQWIAGHTGPFALSFSGNGVFGQDDQSSVDVANSLAPVLGGTATLTAWTSTTQTGADPSYNAPAITGVEQQGAQNDIRWGYLDPSGHIGIDAGDGPAALSTDRINDGNWHFVAFTRDATTGAEQTYLDGALQANVIGDIGLKTSTFRSIGATTVDQLDGVTRVGATYFNGNLDDLRIYDRVLSAAEIAGIYSPASSAPAAPGALTASVSGVDVTLTWKDNASNEAGFEVDRATSPSGPFTSIATLPAVAGTGGNATYTDSAPAFSTTFYYRVLAFNGFNGGAQSAPSNVASAAIGPASTLRPGQIDPTFGSGGLAVILSSASGSIIQVRPDGKVYLARGGTLTRLNANGTIDTTFGTDGTLNLSLNVQVPNFGPMTVQPDGRVILTGTTSQPNPFFPDSNIAIARFNPDGSPDPTWGGSGTVITDIAGRDDSSDGVTVQPDGKILVLANDTIPFEDVDASQAEPALLRYNADGSLDPTFGNGGKVRFALPGLVYSIPTNFLLMPNGDILVTGTGLTPLPNISHPFLVRFEKSGGADYISVAQTVSDAAGIPIPASDGKLLLLNGTTITRLNADFTADTTFGTNGSATVAVGTPGNIDAPTNDSIYGAVVLSDGSVLAAGFSRLFPRLAVIHLLSNGQFDPDFGTEGRVFLNAPGASADGSIAIQNGELLAQSGTVLLRVKPPAATAPLGPPPPAAAAADLSAGLLRLSGLRTPITGNQHGRAIFTLTNAGNAIALGPARFDLYLVSSFSDGVVDFSSGTLLASLSRHLRLRPETAVSLAMRFRLPAQLNVGAYELAVVANATHTIMEVNQQNDVGASPPFSVPPAVGDVAISLPRPAPLVLRQGRRGTLVVQITDDANATVTGTADLTLFASTGRAPDASAPQLFSATIPIHLRPTHARRLRLRFLVPATLPAGTYILTATLTPHVIPDDSNAANNTTASPVGTLVTSS